MSRLDNALYKGIAQEVAPYNLSPIDVHLLMICMETRECTVSQLAQMLPVDASRISRLVTELVDRGLLRRRRLRNDRRVVMLRLSPDGQKITSQISQNMQEYYSKLTDGLSEQEMEVFSRAALRIVSNYEAMQES